MVDDMVGGVGRCVLLDSDLGNMLDLVVDLISDMLDNWGSGNMDSSRGSNMVSSRGSNMVSSRSSMVGNWSSDCDNWGSMGNWVNKAILVNILRESLKGKRSIATVGGNEVTNQRGQRSGSRATV